jgi:hypothetical protein
VNCWVGGINGAGAFALARTLVAIALPTVGGARPRGAGLDMTGMTSRWLRAGQLGSALLPLVRLETISA